MDVTIVIPTKNGGELLDRVLAAVFLQKTQYTYEVICVDSGSKDNTLDIIRKYDCKLYQIPPSEFGQEITVPSREREPILFFLRRMLSRLRKPGFRILSTL